jgi:hypothetical protein
MDLPGSTPARKYQKRPSFYVLRYMDMLINSESVSLIKQDGMLLCLLVARTEDRKYYEDAPTFWTDQLLTSLGIKSRTTLGEVRDRCVNAGLLYYVPGVKGTPMTLWTLWPERWEKIDGGLFLKNAVQKMDSILETENTCCPNNGQKQGNAVQNLDSIPTESRTHSSLVPKTPTTPNSVGAVERIFDPREREIENRLLAAGVAKARETIAEAILNGTTLTKIVEVIDYFASRPGCWGPGALRTRLTLGSAESLPSEQGWSQVSPKGSQIAKAAAVASDRQKQAAASNEMAVQKTKEVQLEFQFGPILDAMPLEQLHKIVRDSSPALMPQLLRFGIQSKLVRPPLLKLLAKIAELSS